MSTRLPKSVLAIMVLGISWAGTAGGAERDRALAMAESWPIRIPDNIEYLEPGDIPPSAMRVPSVINVEVDIMAAAGHIHQLYQAEIDMIVGMFACQGITINIEISDTIPETAVIDMSNTFQTGGSAGFATLKSTWYDHVGQPGWHYCIMAHQYDLGGGPTTSSGYAEILGDDFIVTLGAWSGQTGTPFDRAGTFVHELGHNLSLRHAGGQSENFYTQYKPNYASVMTYRCQTLGVRKMNLCSGLVDNCHVAPFHDLDYSHGLLPPLDEAALIEANGAGLGAVDWNCDFSINPAPVVKDLADYDWCFANGTIGVSQDYDDWSNIVDVSYLASVASLALRPGTSCMALEDLEALRSMGTESSIMNTCDYSSPLVQVEPCVYPADDADTDGILAVCDNCPVVANGGQEDVDLDGKGDGCDNCPALANAGQADGDADGTGDVCDNCPTTPNASQANFDDDPFGDDCDVCPAVAIGVNIVLLSGDVTNDGSVTSQDIISMVNHVFKSGPAPVPVPLVGDADCSGTLTANDIIRLVNYVFKSAGAPCNVCALP